MTQIVLATRSNHKLHEIQALSSSSSGLELVSLTDLGVLESDREDSLEVFDTFEENASAKAHYFAEVTGRPVLADDSGLCVDALEGRPGVHSKRFSQRPDLSGEELDRSNNEKLLASLATVPADARTAHYVCALAFVTPAGKEDLFRGTVDGIILAETLGEGGFGYDPLFFVPALQATFAEVPQSVKNRISHRAKAVAAALPRLHEYLSTGA